MSDRARAGRGRGAGVMLAAFVLLAVAHTWPLASNPAVLSRNDNGDTILNEWIIAWVAHQLPRAPLALFHANIFYPEPNTLAYSEHMFVQGLMGMPLFWLGGSAVLVYNLLVLAGFALTGWAMAMVVERWTGDRAAGLVAGTAAAFNAHSFSRLPHLQALHVEFLPPLLFVVNRFLEEPTKKRGAMVGLLFAAQGLTSVYWLTFCSIGVAAAIVAVPESWWGRARLQRLIVPGAIAAVIALALVVPFLIPYYEVRTTQGLVRGLREVEMYSGHWRDYLNTPTRLHHALWSRGAVAEGGRTALFPGIAVTLLAIAGVVLTGLRSDRRVRMLVATALAATVLSFGAKLPGYAVLYKAFPLLQGVRAPVRAGHLTLVALAALAGFGVAALRTRVSSRRSAQNVFAVAAFAIVTIESWRAPIRYVPAEQPSPVYDVLANERRAVVAEFPFPRPRVAFQGAQYQLNSTRHWRPIVNGYSGFIPRSYLEHWRAFRTFPSDAALSALRDAMVTHVVTRGPDARAARKRADVLELIAEGDGISIFQLRWERIPTGSASDANIMSAPHR